MLKVIDDEKLIRKYARLFARRFKPFADETIQVKLGHQGASYPAKVSWSKKLGVWLFSQAAAPVRHGHAFGTEKPQAGTHLPITAEINFPWSGIDRKTGAAFARDAWDNIYVIHRGKIGGGKKGIGKSLFEENYRGLWAWMEDGDTRVLVAVIGALQSPRFALQTALFIRKIGRLKAVVTPSPQTSLNFPEISFREELMGDPPSAPNDDHMLEACDHDIVLSQLAFLLRRWKFRIGNDAQTDLFLTQPGEDRISHLLSVCATGTQKTVYAAAANLLLRQSGEENCPLAVLILPESAVNQYAQILQRIHVEVMGYRMEGERIIFPDLGKIRLDQNSQL